MKNMLMIIAATPLTLNLLAAPAIATTAPPVPYPFDVPVCDAYSGHCPTPAPIVPDRKVAGDMPKGPADVTLPVTGGEVVTLMLIAGAAGALGSVLVLAARKN